MISRRELARQLRRKAYRDAKARRAEDPRFLAMKEAAKQRRRELYQVAKEKKKAAAAARAEAPTPAPARAKAEGRSARDRSIKESSSKASARAALASALGELRRAKEQREGLESPSELIESLRSSGEGDGVANDRM